MSRGVIFAQNGPFLSSNTIRYCAMIVRSRPNCLILFTRLHSDWLGEITRQHSDRLGEITCQNKPVKRKNIVKIAERGGAVITLTNVYVYLCYEAPSNGPSGTIIKAGIHNLSILNYITLDTADTVKYFCHQESEKNKMGHP